MNEHDMTEQAYKNGYDKGYEDGKRDAVKHGRWEEGCWCSVCHKFSMNAYIKEYANYCPNCGARMDGDGNG